VLGDGIEHRMLLGPLISTKPMEQACYRGFSIG
jgi:hypothetical protein